MFKTWVKEGVLIGILFWNPRDVVSTMLWFPGSPSGDQYGNFAIVPSYDLLLLYNKEYPIPTVSKNWVSWFFVNVN